MKSKLDKALSLVALGVLGVLNSAHAAPVYKIVNIENYDLKGALEGTRNGYALGVNANDELVGISKGKKKLSTSDVESGVIDIEDGIAPEETITYSITAAIVANNFAFVAKENDSSSPWLPTFDSINGTTPPSNTEVINSVDTFYYGINDAGIKVGSMTAPEKKVENTATTDVTDDYWYYRDYEYRGVAKSSEVEIPLIPPYTQYVKDDKTVELGGWSAATAINNNNLIAGYASTDISKYGSDRVAYCLSTDNTLPLDVCVQREQYPNSVGTRNIQYQTRAYVWKIEDDNTATGTVLPLGFTPASDDTLTYTAQALGLNDNDVIVGRSHVYRNGNSKSLAQDAAYWIKDAEGNYQYHWIPMSNSVASSIAYDINDNGIVVGSYRSYIQGYLRDKFFYFDINTPDVSPVTPNDFASKPTDLSSKPKDINNNGQVVGYIETTYDKEKPRPKAGFLYEKSTGEFSNLNKLLTCESKGFEKDGSGNWNRHKVAVQDGSGKTLTYNTDILVVEASSINEEGTIVGTAFVRKPSYQFDSSGNVVIGENGLPLFELSGSGEPVTAYIPRMVVLKPVANGEACPIDDSTDTGNYERKGAASLAWLFALPLIWFRRRVR
ncbi:DUF3466 family protein [Shewanella sp. JNE10-2]|uniref:DUF3466 family protein n=1 Tax=unclassified Shewanella TaxID=196818 RepID=UPI002006A98F|nr:MULTISPECIES: DUF3466 family protein [unclassified Shewanella]MCK7632047.1 DUF3466 family protein [Shewanella sp. JNE9-1]MCK7636231.1 DUF3466 family protein [Shewanella sp. JNE17]MCK7647357.1 DUF3466 family protein [Shewanella sp. JNE3-1]MCK7651400.1 DUF3466 family protein [Shewanella sp. JNE8]MCK7655345.1 DUF3466 family protein [Shewanella sp. JNE4-1]